MPPTILTQLQSFLLPTGDHRSPAPLVRLLSHLSASPSAAPVAAELYGCWGSLPRLVAAVLNHALNRPLLLVTAHIPQADQAQDDLESFAGRPVELFPAFETQQIDIDPTSDLACERQRLCQILMTAPLAPSSAADSSATPSDSSAAASGPPDCPILVAPIPALMQPVPTRDFYQQQTLTLACAAELPEGPEALCRWLVDEGFRQVDPVDVVGDFARRGGIVDLFAPGQDYPLRVEFFGDEIESLRFFDLDSQRSILTVEQITLSGCRLPTAAAQTTTLLDYLPEGTLILIEEVAEVQEIGRIFRDRLADDRGIVPVEDVLRLAARRDVLYLNRFAGGLVESAFDLAARSVQGYENRGAEALAELLEIADHQAIFFFCENPAEQQRIGEKIRNDLLPAAAPAAPDPQLPLQLPVGLVHQGFALPDARLLVLSHHEVFGQHRPFRRIRRSMKTTQAIDSFVDLEKNDLIVHVHHGIGRFLGLKTLTKDGRQQEYLACQYAGRAIVHVPADQIDLVHKYVGGRRLRPTLSKLGSAAWQRQKQKVAAAVEDLAADLIDLQAQRAFAPGIQYPPDTPWQTEFEGSFPYPDTEDQQAVNRDIKTDMQKPRPMDRLLCGDVGYGKTELALRAAFKAIESGKQVAVLVPTTVLAEQHYRTFTERLADFPFLVESLSRLKTPGQSRAILTLARTGRLDILIGTHRLLSDDVAFHDLGLVIIDEEQRFGVEHKERLKRLRRTVDILTLTATPIPRTLHMALLGLRDISSLTTPPLDRRSIATNVCPYNPDTIRQAILLELARDGQVYFLHNRVHNIVAVADRLGLLVPEARILIAHGQMPKHQLEDCMTDFVRHRADVLVCTTIIESGLDIPNANTIIINDADRFGLAELHQLRGRVGRYKNRAYAYLLLPQKRTINPAAVKRLKAIEEFSQLGSGFRIALRDLEIRGAGNILGIEQSGHIDAVGYELYCRLLAQAVARLRGETPPVRSRTHLELGFDCFLPRSYVPTDSQRLNVYRRLVTCDSPADLDQLARDLADLFGPPPPAVQALLQRAEIRMLAGRWAVRTIIRKSPDLIFTLDNMALARFLFADTAGSVRIPDPQTVHLRLAPNYFDSPTTILALLRRLLGKTPPPADHPPSPANP